LTLPIETDLNLISENQIIIEVEALLKHRSDRSERAGYKSV